eukprot:TRINITY_DN34017_c0_g1_i1.p1 TRINITY_DN34017_c0_g1~~TRINITY_DN34017_c0_g1_i1.p1  ORF type:complete len:284 (+),score=24.60 TRINITY_DN34017_c0_g1_i1:93-944(+)
MPLQSLATGARLASSLNSSMSQASSLSQRLEASARVHLEISNGSKDLRLTVDGVEEVNRQCTVHSLVDVIAPSRKGSILLGPGSRKRDLGVFNKLTHALIRLSLESDTPDDMYMTVLSETPGDEGCCPSLPPRGAASDDCLPGGRTKVHDELEVEVSIRIPGAGRLRRPNEVNVSVFNEAGCGSYSAYTVTPNITAKIPILCAGRSYLITLALPDIPTPTIQLSVHGESRMRSRPTSRSVSRSLSPSLSSDGSRNTIKMSATTTSSLPTRTPSRPRFNAGRWL